jgi:hypothetical protein
MQMSAFFLESYGGRRQIDVLNDIALLMLDDCSWLGLKLHACSASSLETDSQLVREVLKTGLEIGLVRVLKPGPKTNFSRCCAAAEKIASGP